MFRSKMKQKEKTVAKKSCNEPFFSLFSWLSLFKTKVVHAKNENSLFKDL